MPFVEDVTAITQFIIELEKLKSVERRIKPVGLMRYENSAEHSWHVALLALTLTRYAPQPLDELKVVHNGCQSWLEHGISVKQILTKNAAIEQANPQLWQWLSNQVIEKAKVVGLKSE